VALVDVQKDVDYVPGDDFEPYPAYDVPFWGAYNYSSYGMGYDPGYYQVNKTYVVNSNLYRLSDQKLVWSEVTNTLNPDSFAAEATGISAAVANGIQRDFVN
jgi:hypothetical protein